MVEVTATGIKKISVGSKFVVYADLTNIQNNYTWIVPHLRKIDYFCVTVSTDDDVSGTVSGNTITFKDGATLAGMIRVEGF